jgi:ATP-dependent exoDNAse (exonuclease V) beta subunit
MQQRFESWLAAHVAAEPQTGQPQPGQAEPGPPEPGLLDSLAASGDADNLVVMPLPARPARLRRLPPDYRVTQKTRVETPASEITAGKAAAQLYLRHEGGMASRALGSAVHSLLERLASLRVSQGWEAAHAALQSFGPRVAAEARGLGLGPDEAGQIAMRAMRYAIDASNDPYGEWILSPHPQAASEAQWTGVVNGQLRTVRVDRIFQAGAAPRSEGDTHWWIVDYKTAHPEGLTPEAALPELRRLFAAQLEAYAEVLRMLHGDGKPIRAAIYYPLMKALDWWEV